MKEDKAYKEERSVRGCETTTTLASFKLEMVKWYIMQLYREGFLNFQESLFLMNNANVHWYLILRDCYEA